MTCDCWSTLDISIEPSSEMLEGAFAALSCSFEMSEASSEMLGVAFAALFCSLARIDGSILIFLSGTRFY
jgi:hypothetical protein